MSRCDIANASRPSRWLLAGSLLLWLLLAFVLPLSALTFNVVRIAGFPLGYWIAAQGALLGLAILALVFARRAGGTGTGEGVRPALQVAGDVMGAAMIIGLTGAIAATGYDGLALTLGLAAGLALATLLIAPRFVLYPVASIGGFFAQRFGGVWPRRVALAIMGLAVMLLLAADVRASALALQGIIGAAYPGAVAAVALSIGAIWLIVSLYAARRKTGFVFLLIAIGFLVALLALAAHAGAGGFPVPHISLGYSLESLAELDQDLVAKKLSDFKALKPMASPFLQMSMTNFAGLLLAVVLGLAAAPHLIGRHASQAAVAPGDATRRMALATLLVALFAVSLPPYAIQARLSLEQALSVGIEITAVPAALSEANAHGWISVCNEPSASPSELAAACAKMPGQRGFLRLQDVSLPPDSFILAAPVIANMAPELRYPLWFACLLAGLAAGYALLNGFLSSDGEARRSGSINPSRLDGRSVTVGVALLLAATLIAMFAALDVASLATEGFALLAAGIFPALVLGLYWRRVTAAGAVSAMLVGAAIAIAYIGAIRLFPVEMFEWTRAMSTAAPAAVRRFEVLRNALDAATGAEAWGAARAALRAHAATIANWWGLKPAAIVLIAVPAGTLAGIAVSLVTAPRDEQPPASVTPAT